jgi:hypothetical protein
MCNNSTPSPTGLTGGLTGYLVTPGYDQATGWGSLDGNNLLAALGPTQASASISLSAASSPIYLGNNDNFTAAVSTASGKPTGFVQFYLNGATLGSAVSLASNGQAASPVVTFAALGTQSVYAVYSGDVNFAASRSSGLSLPVNSPGFSITATPVSLSFAAGAATGNSAVLTYTSLGGFAGNINQSCTVTYNGGGTPSNVPTCSFSAQTIILPSSGTVTGTIAISSIAPGGAGGSGSASREDLRHVHAGNNPAELAGIFMGALFLTNLANSRRRRVGWRQLLVAALIGGAMLSISGCGGASSGGGPSPPSGSTTGSYTVALTSSSGTTSATPAASISLTLH